MAKTNSHFECSFALEILGVANGKSNISNIFKYKVKSSLIYTIITFTHDQILGVPFFSFQ